ncbi:MAG: hypothetical protein A2104_04780 [Candidatus Melainabacteria bacterium GWF2_32_7]|nr:MAG: hypothetical protein A2104_04780 [Candidatus Melainabacteria bacterium GWF2_32_7]
MKNYWDKSNIYDSFNRLYNYVIKHDYTGIDVFDGLNSKLFKDTPLYKSKLFRLALIQFCKRSPVNFRKLLLVSPGFNPKAGALFLLGNLNMYKATNDDQYKNEAERLFYKLKETHIHRYKGISWGYNFEWQARAFFVPIDTPNIVTTVYVGKALLEYYNIFQDKESLELAVQAAEFILNEMIKFEDENKLCFGYIPEEDAEVHNANLLAASFLSSLNQYIKIPDLDKKIIKSLNFSISDINKDGSWPYGTKPFHRWVDNFHTAFNIESLINIKENLNLIDLTRVIDKVTDFYFDELFTNEGMPKYYNNNLYPVDIHVIAEAIILINRLKLFKITNNQEKIAKIEKKLLELINVFQDKKGYFYYQKGKYFWNKTPYIRWAQAWMFYALSDIILFEKLYSNNPNELSQTQVYNL